MSAISALEKKRPTQPWVPTPWEIISACAEIRARWSRAEREAPQNFSFRQCHFYLVETSTPVMPMADSDSSCLLVIILVIRNNDGLQSIFER